MNEQIRKTGLSVQDGRHSRRTLSDGNADTEALKAEYAKAAQRLAAMMDENIRLKRELAAMRNTFSWRITGPLRFVRGLIRRPAVPRQPLGPRIARKAIDLYRRSPMSLGMRMKLHQTLHKLSPALYARLRRTAGAAPAAPAAASPERVSPDDILASTAFRAGFRRLTADIAAHTRAFGPITHVIALPFFAVGGAQLTALNFARAVTAKRQACILIATDKDMAGARPADVNGLMAFDLEDYFSEADPVAREHLLFAILRMVRPRVLHIINAEVGWRMLIRMGARVRGLTRVFGSIFAFQYDSRTGAKIGYAATFLKPALASLDGVIADNQRFVDDAVREYGLQAQRRKFHVAYNASEATGDDARARGEAYVATLPERIRNAERLSVLWAGRLDAEKRPELLLAVARACPYMDFHIYGERVVDSTLAADFAGAPNLLMQGPYDSAEDVMSRREHHAMLFTSRWEGLANVLIEFGAQGLPIIAATVGGVGELINDATGYPVSEKPAADDYVVALHAIRGDPDGAAARSARLMALIAQRHSRTQFEQAVAEIPGYLG